MPIIMFEVTDEMVERFIVAFRDGDNDWRGKRWDHKKYFAKVKEAMKVACNPHLSNHAPPRRGHINSDFGKDPR